jgi:hypothetical protein
MRINEGTALLLLIRCCAGSNEPILAVAPPCLRLQRDSDFQTLEEKGSDIYLAHGIDGRFLILSVGMMFACGSDRDVFGGL